jgi:hypothetical protein
MPKIHDKSSSISFDPSIISSNRTGEVPDNFGDLWKGKNKNALKN